MDKPTTYVIPTWRGIGYRAYTFAAPANATLVDILTFEVNEYNNKVASLAENLSARLEINLSDIAATDVLWVSRTEDEALTYSLHDDENEPILTVDDLESHDVNGWLILADLGADGALVVYPGALPLSLQASMHGAALPDPSEIYSAIAADTTLLQAINELSSALAPSPADVLTLRMLIKQLPPFTSDDCCLQRTQIKIIVQSHQLSGVDIWTISDSPLPTAMQNTHECRSIAYAIDLTLLSNFVDIASSKTGAIANFGGQGDWLVLDEQYHSLPSPPSPYMRFIAHANGGCEVLLNNVRVASAYVTNDLGDEHIKNLWVAPEHRRLGIATYLCDAIEFSYDKQFLPLDAEPNADLNAFWESRYPNGLAAYRLLNSAADKAIAKSTTVVMLRSPSSSAEITEK